MCVARQDLSKRFPWVPSLCGTIRYHAWFITDWLTLSRERIQHQKRNPPHPEQYGGKHSHSMAFYVRREHEVP